MFVNLKKNSLFLLTFFCSCKSIESTEIQRKLELILERKLFDSSLVIIVNGNECSSCLKDKIRFFEKKILKKFINKTNYYGIIYTPSKYNTNLDFPNSTIEWKKTKDVELMTKIAEFSSFKGGPYMIDIQDKKVEVYLLENIVDEHTK